MIKVKRSRVHTEETYMAKILPYKCPESYKRQLWLQVGPRVLNSNSHRTAAKYTYSYYLLAYVYHDIQ